MFSTDVPLQDFELEIAGAHMMKVQVCSKSLLKEETYAHGKIRVRERERGSVDSLSLWFNKMTPHAWGATHCATKFQVLYPDPPPELKKVWV